MQRLGFGVLCGQEIREAIPAGDPHRPARTGARKGDLSEAAGAGAKLFRPKCHHFAGSFGSYRDSWPFL